MAILVVRDKRLRLFPAEIFDEYAWTMLLHLFVSMADNLTMTEQRLIELTGVSKESGRRWIAHLVADDQITARSDGDDVILSSGAVERMRTFLEEASTEAHEVEAKAS